MAISDKLDAIDRHLCKAGVLSAATWETVLRQEKPKLYAGELSRHIKQFKTHIGITPFVSSTRNILHDIRVPMPVPNNCINVFQSEDVFEHINYADIGAIVEDVHRILKPGGLFRVSVPDYRSPVLLKRSRKNEAGRPVFDPGGGGAFRSGKVVGGGHLWFPIYETVKALFDASSFSRNGKVEFLQYTMSSGESVLRQIDYTLGDVMRTPDHDERARCPLQALSIVVDARK
jgi:hypothetical protein